jgi:hypothetical protein
VDVAAAKKTAIAGPTSKAEAQKVFAERHASKYTAKYASEPTTRPSHIPQSTVGSDGASHNVTYNHVYGGYGYMGPGGWVMYDVMRDTMMLSMLMSHHHDTVVVSGGHSGVTHVHHGNINGGIIFLFIIVGLGIVFVVYHLFIR